MLLPPEELDATIRAQVRLLVELGEEEGWPVRYVKLHGALANMAAEEPAIAALCFAVDRGAGARHGDPRHRQFRAGRKWPRRSASAPSTRPMPTAPIRPTACWCRARCPAPCCTTPPSIAERAVRLATAGEIVAADGSVINTRARSLCIHGDTPDAVAIARAVKTGPCSGRG